MKTAKNIIANLNKYAKLRKMSVKKIITQSGISYSSYLWNKRTGKFTTEHVDKICSFLNITPGQLMDQENHIEKIKVGLTNFIDNLVNG